MPSSSSGRRRSATSLRNALLLGEAEGDDVALDADRPAGGDQRLHGAVAVADRRRRSSTQPRAEALEVVVGRRGAARAATGVGRGSAASASGGGRAAAAPRRAWLEAAGSDVARAAAGRAWPGVRRARPARPAGAADGGRVRAGARDAASGSRQPVLRGRPSRGRSAASTAAATGCGDAPARDSSSASSSWRRSPPGPRRVGSIDARRRAATASGRVGRGAGAERRRAAARGWRRRPGRGRPGGRGRAPRAGRGGRCRRPRRRVASASTKPVDELGVGEAEQVADGVRLDPARRSRTRQLVEDRLGVAHPARGEAGDERDRLGVGLAAVGGEDPLELAADLGHREPPDVEPLEPRQDRRRELLGVGASRT